MIGAVSIRTRGLLAGGVLLALLSAFAPACSGSQDVDPTTYTEAAEYTYERGERAFDRRDYELARSFYLQVYQSYPYSQYAALSELRIADCFFQERLYARAIEAYRRFVRFHPTHQRVPEAEFKVALAYYEQLPGDWFLMPPSYERDLSRAESAYAALNLFLSVYDDSEFAEEATEMQQEVMNRLANHELYVAEFYLERDNPLATANRAEYLLDTYPLSNVVPNALFLLARSMIELGDVDEALVALRRLEMEFPDHELGREAGRYLDRHGLE